MHTTLAPETESFGSAAITTGQIFMYKIRRQKLE